MFSSNVNSYTLNISTHLQILYKNRVSVNNYITGTHSISHHLVVVEEPMSNKILLCMPY